jgi:hypothetical protein
MKVGDLVRFDGDVGIVVEPAWVSVDGTVGILINGDFRYPHAMFLEKVI